MLFGINSGWYLIYLIPDSNALAVYLKYHIAAKANKSFPTKILGRPGNYYINWMHNANAYGSDYIEYSLFRILQCSWLFEYDFYNNL